jgi:hypothetical protein
VIPAEHTKIIVEAELPGAQAWAQRRGLLFQWVPEQLQVRVTLTQPVTSEVFYLRGFFDDYRAMAPEWSFTDAQWVSTGDQHYSPPTVQTFHGASIFINHENRAVICVPFNRLAYKQKDGPHTDWEGPANWLNVKAPHIHADTVADMLQAIYRDFVYSRGRMRP